MRRHPGYRLWQRNVKTKRGSIYFPSDMDKWLFRKVGETWCVWPPHNERPAYQYARHPLGLTRHSTKQKGKKHGHGDTDEHQR